MLYSFIVQFFVFLRSLVFRTQKKAVRICRSWILLYYNFMLFCAWLLPLLLFFSEQNARGHIYTHLLTLFPTLSLFAVEILLWRTHAHWWKTFMYHSTHYSINKLKRKRKCMKETALKWWRNHTQTLCISIKYWLYTVREVMLFTAVPLTCCCCFYMCYACIYSCRIVRLYAYAGSRNWNLWHNT